MQLVKERTHDRLFHFFDEEFEKIKEYHGQTNAFSASIPGIPKHTVEAEIKDDLVLQIPNDCGETADFKDQDNPEERNDRFRNESGYFSNTDPSGSSADPFASSPGPSCSSVLSLDQDQVSDRLYLEAYKPTAQHDIPYLEAYKPTAQHDRLYLEAHQPTAGPSHMVIITNS